jgi:hypothetical protein
MSAFVILATPLLLPIRYGFLTSMPRGFVTGMLFAAIPACLLMFRMSPARLFACGFLLVLSVSVHPGAAILALPVGLCLLFENSESRDFYRWGGAGLVLAAGLHVLSVDFYRLNPAYVVYGPGFPPLFAFDLGLFRDNLLNGARYLGDVAPALPGGVALGVLVFGLTLWGLARRGAAACVVALLAGGLLILLSGCGSGRSGLEVPDPASVKLMQATVTGTREGSRSSDRESQAYMLSVVSEVSADWTPSTDLLAPTLYSAGFSTEGNRTLLVVWIGEDWAAANDMQGRPNLYGRLVDPQREKLLRALGVGPYFDAVE